MDAGDIVEVLASRRHDPARRKDISRALGADDPAQLERVRELLTELEQTGTIIRVHNRRYSLPDPALHATGRVEMKRRTLGIRRRLEFAFVIPTDGSQEDIYISGRDVGGAIHGDIVVVEILAPRRQRAAGPNRRGRVVRIVRRARTQLTGIFEPGFDGGGRVIPDDAHLSFVIHIPSGKGGDARKNEKVIAEITRFPENDGIAHGAVVKRLGAAGSWPAELAAIIERFGLRTEFPPDVLEQARALPETIAPHELACRADYRDELTVTIDPEDAKDIDDAIRVERLTDENGRHTGWRLRVHIADVSQLVPEDSAIDREARLRSTSVYLPGKNLPMLPQRLSGDLCSLRSGCDRLTKTATIEFAPDGERVNQKIERSVIRSDYTLAYRTVKTMFDDDNETDEPVVSGELVAMLAEARELTRVLRERRLREGSLDMDLPEMRVVLDADDNVVGVESSQVDWTHQLIEEYMLAANRVVAEYLLAQKLPGVFRVHDEPNEAALEGFADFARSLGFSLRPPYDRRRLQRVVEAAQNGPHAQRVQIALLRSLKQARYSARCGDHYALAFARYCHFTSPIRRYPDLFVHRELDRCFPEGKSLLPPSARRNAPGEDESRTVARVAEHASYTERNADRAEKDATEFRQLQFLKKQDEDRRDGVISDVFPSGFLVELAGSSVKGFVSRDDLLDDEYKFDETGRSLCGVRRKRRFRLGDAISVHVRNIDLAARRVDLSLAPVAEDKQTPSGPGERGVGRRKPRRKRSRGRRSGREA